SCVTSELVTWYRENGMGDAYPVNVRVHAPSASRGRKNAASFASTIQSHRMRTPTSRGPPDVLATRTVWRTAESARALPTTSTSTATVSPGSWYVVTNPRVPMGVRLTG